MTTNRDAAPDQLHCDVCQARFQTRWEFNEHLKEEQIKAKQIALDSALMSTHQPPADQSVVPDEARLTEEEISDIVCRYDEDTDFIAYSVEDAAKTAAEKAWHSRDAEVNKYQGNLEDAMKRVDVADAKVAELQEQIDKLANYIMANIPGEPSQSQGAVDTAIRVMAELREQLDVIIIHRQFLVERAEKKRDTALEQVRGLVEAAENMLKEDSGVDEWAAIRRAIAAAKEPTDAE